MRLFLFHVERLMKHLTILGSTGSIGCSTLDVIRHNPEEFSVTALVAGKNVARMVEQCLEFRPRFAVMDDEASARELRETLRQHGSRTEVLAGRLRDGGARRCDPGDGGHCRCRRASADACGYRRR